MNPFFKFVGRLKILPPPLKDWDDVLFIRTELWTASTEFSLKRYCYEHEQNTARIIVKNIVLNKYLLFYKIFRLTRWSGTKSCLKSKDEKNQFVDSVALRRWAYDTSSVADKRPVKFVTKETNDPGPTTVRAFKVTKIAKPYFSRRISCSALLKTPVLRYARNVQKLSFATPRHFFFMPKTSLWLY